jgi:hypothetical protein
VRDWQAVAKIKGGGIQTYVEVQAPDEPAARKAAQKAAHDRHLENTARIRYTMKDVEVVWLIEGAPRLTGGDTLGRAGVVDAAVIV